MSDQNKENEIDITISALADIIFNSWLENQETNKNNYVKKKDNK